MVVYLNLPVCLVALAVLILALRGVDVGVSQETSWRRFAHTFDFLGLYVSLTPTRQSRTHVSAQVIIHVRKQLHYNWFQLRREFGV